MLEFPTISVNSDSIMKYRATHETFTQAAASTQNHGGKIFPYDGNRRIILGAATSGVSLNIGLYKSVTTIPIAVTVFADGEPDTAIVGTTKLTFTLDVAVDYDIADMLGGTIAVYLDGVKVAQDDGDTDGVGAFTARGNSGLFLPDGAWLSTINYTTGACVVYLTTPVATTYDVTISYTSDTVDADTNLTVTGTAPLDLSMFLRNSPYSFFKEGYDLIIKGEVLKDTVFAYSSMRG